MKNYPINIKILVQAAIALLLPISVLAQLRTPENVPITFYGKVVDQDGKPLAGAKVSLVVVTSHFAENRTDKEPVALETDQIGNFTLTGFTAYAIDEISIQKHGYELSQKVKRGYRFGAIPDDYKPDPANPVVFKVWKHQHPDTLIHLAWHGKVPCDGTINRFDLSSGNLSTNGNLEIICSRIPVNLPPANINPFTYKLQIIVIGGGIRATDDEFTYLAAENDYSSSLSFGQTADTVKWNRNTPIPKDYYIKTADGHYGRLSLKWDLAYAQSPTILKWECFINPTGSRNLEYDKLAEIRKHLSHPDKMPLSNYP
jgi:hypothetical protein